MTVLSVADRVVVMRQGKVVGNMGIKETSMAVSLGVVIAGLIMGLASTGVFAVIGL